MPLDSQEDLIPFDGKSSTGMIGPGAQEVAYWNNQIKLAKAREEKYRKEAKRFVEIYEADKQERTPFNILYSNTETLQPALYNETPRPIVQRRFKDEDPMGKLVSQALQRALEYVVDTPDATYTTFGELMNSAVLSALVPGRGITRFNYDADIEGEDLDDKKLKDADIAEDGASDTSGDVDGEEANTANLKTGGQPGEAGGNATDQPAGDALPLGANDNVAPAPRVAYEAVCGETCEWDRITLGYAKRWKDVPWVAFEHWMTKQDVAVTFGKPWARKLLYKSVGGAAGDSDDKRNKQQDKRTEQVVVVQEIWHKATRRVLFIAEGFEFRPVKKMKDPLGLSGFYNIPEPLMLFTRINGLVPKPLYCQYEEQAGELNDLTKRIRKIVNALKVRGFYDQGVGDLKQLLTQDDNVLLPAKTVGAMREGVTLESSIWLMPIEKLVMVLQQLVVQREQVKQVIYEITGIADIMRGASVASETYGAQQLKNQWGTLRLKKMQKRVQKYVKDSLRISAEIIAKHFGEDTLAKETGLPIQTSQQKQQAQMALQSMPPPAPPAPPPAAPPSDQAPLGPDGQAAPQDGGAPQAPPPDPAAQAQQQQTAQLQAQAQAPSWGDIMEVMKNDLQRNYKVDIETNSTVDPEAVEDKSAMAEMMQALAQILQQFMPLVQSGVMPMPTFKAMLSGILRRYRFGEGVEDAIAAMPDQVPQQGPDPKQLEAQQKQLAGQQQQVAQKQMQVDQSAAQLEMDKQAFEQQKQMAEEMMKMKEEMAKQRIEMEQQQAEMALEKMQLKGEHSLQMKTMQDQFAVSDKLSQGEQRLAQKDSDIRTNQKIKDVETKAQGRAVESGLEPIANLIQPVQEALQQVLAGVGELHKSSGSTKRIKIRKTADGYEGESSVGNP